MTNDRLALRAAGTAAIVLFGLIAFIFFIAGFWMLVGKLFGVIGSGLLYVAVLFVIFWFCAAADLISKEEREAAQGIEAGTDETPQAAQPEGREPGPSGCAPTQSVNP